MPHLRRDSSIPVGIFFLVILFAGNIISPVWTVQRSQMNKTVYHRSRDRSSHFQLKFNTLARPSHDLFVTFILILLFSFFDDTLLLEKKIVTPPPPMIRIFLRLINQNRNLNDTWIRIILFLLRYNVLGEWKKVWWHCFKNSSQVQNWALHRSRFRKK